MTQGPRGRHESAGPGVELGCPRCGAHLDPGQEYCLECGLRLERPGAGGAIRARWLRSTGREPAAWLLAVGLAAVVAAAGAALAIVLSHDHAQGGTLVFTSRVTSQGLQSVTVDTGTLPTPPTQTSPTSTGPVPTRPPSSPKKLIPWPSGRSGYTVILNSIPRTPEGRRLAVAQARGAIRRGLSGVGVLDASLYSSLHPGYWAVFYGVFDTADAAAGAVSRARSAGFAGAYSKQVTT